MVSASLLNWTIEYLLVILTILPRVAALLFLMPVLGSRSVPLQVKALLTVLTATVLAPVVGVRPDQLPLGTAGYLLLVVAEVAFGAILALFARLIFAAVDTAGQMVGIQMGIGVAGVMDPQFGTQVSIIGQFWNIITILIFLGINGHHLFFSTLADSFAWVGPGRLHLGDATLRGITEGIAHMFVLAVQIMAPVTGVLFFTQVALGILAKTVPQINLLIVSLPLNIAIGLLFVGMSLGLFVPLLESEFQMLHRLLPRLAMGLGG